MEPNAPMTDQQIAEAIAKMSGDRVTEDTIKARIQSVDYSVIPNSTVTLCNITLNNGYSVRGESACVDPANFNEELGRAIAFKQAFGKLWPLFGFLLAEARFQRANHS